MSEAVRRNVVIDQGRDWERIIDVTVDGIPADLTGYTAAAQLRRDVADRDPVAVEINALIDQASVVLSLNHAVTEMLVGGYLWDTHIVSPENALLPLMWGTATVRQQVTR